MPDGEGAFNRTFHNAFSPSGALARQDPPRSRQDWIHFDETEQDWTKRPTTGALRLDKETYDRLYEFLTTSRHTGTHGAVNPLEIEDYGINAEAPRAAAAQSEAEAIGSGGLSRYGNGPRRLGEM